MEDISTKASKFSGWNRTTGKRNTAHRNFCSHPEEAETGCRGAAGVALSDAVITCPAYFGDNERAATKEAGIIAGFNVLGVLR